MKTVTTTDGRTLYVVTTIPQIDGTRRRACAPTAREAREAAERLRDDPALIDHLDLTVVEG